ncbi:glycosyltransferase family 25 protein [Shewanella oncorhynchi]|uniref:Glycosyltransferase family 25 protein n=1 Tax=Shewanella oncorhynchi TaxID=2726434 RepID=A0AA50KGB4_9GAMM|nr:glycosyltransferase family 25 protein [Shewanella oncorhynchi]WMB74457.1 glycosyltransferase family 25 protein [Shewanella oncorhynchi]
MKNTIYVVSLADEIARRANFNNQAKSSGFEFEYIDAVDFRYIDTDDLVNFTSSTQQGTIKRVLTKGEVGCALSHFKCYQKLLADDANWAWIIEDDADLGRLKPDSIENIISLVEEINVDVIILGHSKLAKDDESLFYLFEPLKNIANGSNFALGKPWKNWTCGTVSYLISQAGAKKMLDFFADRKVVTVADDWRFFEEKVGLNIAHYRPLLVFEDFLNFQSALESDRAQVSKRRIDFLDPVRVLRGYLRMLLMRLMP